MQITGVTAYAIKAGQRYQPLGQTTDSPQLPHTDYLRFEPLPQLYSQRAEAVVVKIDTDAGITGWGESQTPVGPEIVQEVIKRVLGPAVLGAEPRAVRVRYDEMLGTMRVRGQGFGYHLDAMAGIDMALWDIWGKATNQSLAQLAGGRRVDRLPGYVTGLRAPTRADRQVEARAWVDQGLAVKLALGMGVEADTAEIEAIGAAVERRGMLLADGLWSYDQATALRTGRALESVGALLFEAPMAPEDVAGHARLQARLELPIAIGESLRSRHEFLPWLQAGAASIVQPDVMRASITETIRIADLAQSFHVPVMLHTGCSTTIGMAATWQLAACLSHGGRQELQPVMLEQFNPWLHTPLTVTDGQLLVPDGPGLGIELDQQRLLTDVDNTVIVGRPTS